MIQISELNYHKKLHLQIVQFDDDIAQILRTVNLKDVARGKK